MKPHYQHRHRSPDAHQASFKHKGGNPLSRHRGEKQYNQQFNDHVPTQKCKSQQYGGQETLPAVMNKKLHGGYSFQCSLLAKWVILTLLFTVNIFGSVRAADSGQVTPADVPSSASAAMMNSRRALPTAPTSVQGFVPLTDSPGNTTGTVATVHTFSLGDSTVPAVATTSRLQPFPDGFSYEPIPSSFQPNISRTTSRPGLDGISKLDLHTTTVTLPTSSLNISTTVPSSTFSDSLLISFGSPNSSFAPSTSATEDMSSMTIDTKKATMPAQSGIVAGLGLTSIDTGLSVTPIGVATAGSGSVSIDPASTVTSISVAMAGSGPVSIDPASTVTPLQKISAANSSATAATTTTLSSNTVPASSTLPPIPPDTGASTFTATTDSTSLSKPLTSPTAADSAVPVLAPTPSNLDASAMTSSLANTPVSAIDGDTTELSSSTVETTHTEQTKVIPVLAERTAQETVPLPPSTDILPASTPFPIQERIPSDSTVPSLPVATHDPKLKSPVIIKPSAAARTMSPPMLVQKAVGMVRMGATTIRVWLSVMVPVW